MPVYVALLRGINVGAHNRVKMEQLRSSLEALGYGEVRTYIQSGNAVFRSEKREPVRISQAIEQKLREAFGFSVTVITRSREELFSIIEGNPFLNEKIIENFKLHVMFLPTAPDTVAREELKQLTSEPDQCCLIGKNLYLYLPHGVARSSLENNAIARRHLGRGTMRNWNTISALYKLASNLQ